MKKEEKTIISLRKDALQQLLTLTHLGAMDTQTFYCMMKCIYMYEERAWEDTSLDGEQCYEELENEYKVVLESIRQGGFLAYNRYTKINTQIEENNERKREMRRRANTWYIIDGVRKKWSAMTDQEKFNADEGLYETELQDKKELAESELPFSV